MNNIKVFILLLIVSCLSCGNKKEDTNGKNATLVKATDAFADSIFFQLISDIELSEGRLFFSDLKTSQIITSDIFLERPRLIRFNYGRGPLDIFQNTQIEVSENQLIINDAGNKKFIVRDLNNNTTSSFSNLGLRHGEFSVVDHIYYVPYGSDTSVRIIDRLSLTGKKSPGIAIFSNKYKSFAKGSFHTLIHNNFLITIPVENTTIIQVRDLKNNQLISEADLSKLDPLIDRSLREFESKGYPSNASLMLFPDATIFNNKLYLMLSYYNDEGSPKSNIVLVFSIDKRGEIESDRKILLREDGWYEALEILSQDQLVTFDHVNGTIELYEF
jgi:hypothetical protein